MSDGKQGLTTCRIVCIPARHIGWSTGLVSAGRKRGGVSASHPYTACFRGL